MVRIESATNGSSKEVQCTERLSLRLLRTLGLSLLVNKVTDTRDQLSSESKILFSSVQVVKLMVGDVVSQPSYQELHDSRW